MLTTTRSLAVGVVACLLAFLIAILGKINTTFNTLDAILVGVSYIVGLLTAITLSRRWCRHDFERGNAVMVFSFSFLAGVYAPITAIWANASLYRWVSPLTAKPKSDMMARYLPSAVEHTAFSYYVGAILLLTGGWLIARRIGQTSRRPNPLGWPQTPDVIFAIATFLVAGVVTRWFARMGDPHTASALQWLAYACGAFLLSLLFRSIRLQWLALRTTQSAVSAPILPRRVSYVTIITLWLGFPLCALIGIRFQNHSDVWDVRMIGLVGIGCVLPWACYCFLASGLNKVGRQSQEYLGALAMRCGFWSGLAMSFIIGGLVVVGLADKILRTAPPDVATPFALGVIALQPIYPLFALSSMMVGVGGFLVAAIFPPSTGLLPRITACAHGGAVLLVVNYVLTILIALSWALLTVCLIPVGKPLPPEVITYFIPGNWYRLSLFYFELLAAFAAGGAVFWALEASIVCGLIWLKECIFPKPPVTGPTVSPSPVRSPPPTPSA